MFEECGVDLNAVTVDGTTAFHWAVWQGQLNVCRWVIEIGCNWKSLNKYGCHAMQWAAQTDRLDVCRFLTHSGLDPTLFNCNGHSASHKAAVKGQYKVCRWLVQGVQLGATQIQAYYPHYTKFYEDGNLLPDAALHQALAGLGIEAESLVVVHGRGWAPTMSACRVVWALRMYVGMSSVRMLNGGFGAWVQSGGDLDAAAVAPSIAHSAVQHVAEVH